jgi:broad specificity phosphatase PhoE
VLVLVRHGRTGANAGRRLQGRLDLLDDVGLAQAADVAVGSAADRVISSPMWARQTAEAFGLPYEVDE